MKRLQSMVAALVVLGGCAEGSPEVDLMIAGARLFDGTGAVVEDATISISGERIHSVGVEVRPRVRIDAAGRTVIRV